MSYNSEVATSMYNTRRTSYMNHEEDEGNSSGLQQWATDNDYIPTSCHSSGSSTNIKQEYMTKGRSSSPAENFYETEKKSSRKRANTTSSGGGDNKRTANKICRVCGDKAFSYNFNVITCESCKAFFRRNANKEKDIRCPFNDRCEINIVSRRFCQRCRLAKCFNVGMKKEWIMSDEARLEKKQRVEENRERRLQDALNRVNEEDNNDSEQSLDEAPTSQHQSMSSMGDYTSPNRHHSHIETSDAYSLFHHQQHEIMHHQHQQQQHHHHQQQSQHHHHLQHHHQESEQDQLHHQQNGYQDYGDMNGLTPNNSQVCHSHQIVDPIPTAGALSTADVSATTTSIPSTMDIDPTTTMTSNGFMPPSLALGEGQNSVVAMPNPEDNVMTAQAQAQASLAVQVQHVQAAINHQQQQLAAAVVARQVVAQMSVPPPSVPQINPLPLPINAIANTLPAPPVVPPAAAVAVVAAAAAAAAANGPAPQVMSSSSIAPATQSPGTVLMNQFRSQPNSEMITVPKEMLLKLIQTNALRSMTCSCTCACGRYPPGSNIVEEVTKDLLNGGSSSSSSADPQNKEEAKLDTAEDMQRNGLLPSDDSSVQWFNTGTPTVDPSTFNEEICYSRRDSIFNPMLIEGGLIDNEPREFSHQEKAKLEEVNEVANRWISDGLDNFSFMELLSENGLKLIIDGLSILTTFRYLSRREKKAIICRGIHAYCIVKWIQHYGSISLDEIPKSVASKLSNLISADVGHFRVQPGTFNTLAIMIIFDADNNSQFANIVHGERDEYSRLLQKVVISNNQCNGTDYPQLYDIIPEVHEAAHILRSVTGEINEVIVNNLV